MPKRSCRISAAGQPTRDWVAKFSRTLACVLPWTAVLAQSARADDDAYLKALEAETHKMSEISEVAPPPEQPVVTGERTHAAFEAMLRKHKGTFALYRRLLPKDRAEIFKAYREGADFKTLRHKIVSRRLHQ